MASARATPFLLAAAAAAAAGTPAVLASRNGLPDFSGEFMGQVLSYKKAAVVEKVKEVGKEIKKDVSIVASSVGGKA